LRVVVQTAFTSLASLEGIPMCRDVLLPPW
jgi:hypothetical protein